MSRSFLNGASAAQGVAGILEEVHAQPEFWTISDSRGKTQGAEAGSGVVGRGGELSSGLDFNQESMDDRVPRSSPSWLSRRSIMAMATMAKTVPPHSSNPRTHCADRSTSAVAIFRAISVPHTQRSRTQRCTRFLLYLPIPAPTLPGRFSTRWHRARLAFLGQLTAPRRAGPRRFFELSEVSRADLVGPGARCEQGDEVDYSFDDGSVEDGVDG
ncbi:hypothetical protein V8E53_009741 [Lactarius tabidus]